jgi:hypothetical protein
MRSEDSDAALELPDDPESGAEEAAAATRLDQLDSEEDFGAPEETAHDSPPLSRQEIDRLVDRALDEELKQLSGSAPRPKA